VLRPGDIVVSAIGRNVRRCAIAAQTERLLASDRLFIVRVNNSGVTPEYVVEYLNSTLAQRLIEGRYAGTGGLMLNARALGSMLIPILERPVAIDLRQIGALEAELRSTADELSDKRKSLFDFKDALTFYQSLQDLRRRGELLSRSVGRWGLRKVLESTSGRERAGICIANIGCAAHHGDQ
jgi:hypothetical protein